jgi:hypothetical protein
MYKDCFLLWIDQLALLYFQRMAEEERSEVRSSLEIFNYVHFQVSNMQ